MDRQSRRRWCRWLAGQGLSPAQSAFVLNVPEDLVKRDLLVHDGRTPRPLSPGYRLDPATCHNRRILNTTGKKIDRLRELGYAPPAIARVLMLDVVSVVDWIARTTPMGPEHCRHVDKLQRPRYPVRDRAFRQARARAEARRLERLERAERSKGWTWSDLRTSRAAELAEHARFLEAVRSGRLAPDELLALAARAYAVPARPVVEVPAPSPAIWTGAASTHFTGPRVLSSEQILEAVERLRAGESYRAVAERFNVARNTLRAAVDGMIGARRPDLVTAPTSPLLFRGVLSSSATTSKNTGFSGVS